jgi:YesN/AraC family two-component response regulator
MPTRTILLVEDEELVGKYLEQLLEKSGWQVTAVRSGLRALDALASARFDAILCDLDLGAGLNGLEVFDRLPARSGGTPFVVLTGHATSERCRNAFLRGVTDFIQKPMSPVQLCATLDRAVASYGAKPAELPDAAEERTTVGDGRVRRALREIDRRFADPSLSVASLADACGLTPEHLARLFRAHLGRTPVQQIHEARVAAAERLLVNPSLSIYAVAVDCGYRDTSELDRWLRRLRRATPSAWRAHHAEMPRTSDLP